VSARHPLSRRRSAPSRRQRREERTLVGECEAFMAGHLAERAARRGAPLVPALWLNLLAHGSEDDLVTCASLLRPLRGWGVGRDDEATWYAARAYLAGVVLESARRCCSLVELQAEVLIPLEADLAGNRTTRTWLPRQLVGAVETAIDVHRAWHGHAAER